MNKQLIEWAMKQDQDRLAKQAKLIGLLINENKINRERRDINRAHYRILVKVLHENRMVLFSYRVALGFLLIVVVIMAGLLAK